MNGEIEAQRGRTAAEIQNQVVWGQPHTFSNEDLLHLWRVEVDQWFPNFSYIKIT